jgi:hypothetical protein
MAINFPNSPAVNDTFTVGGINFTFTGVKWESGAVVELSSDTTPTLGGNLDGGAKNINNVGVITATGFSGPLTGNVTGNADTATTATNAQGLTGDPSIQVTNATVLGNLDVQGTTSTIDTAITQVDSLSVEGSVGIGTTNPQRKFVVSDNGTEGLEFFPGDSVNGSTINVYNRATGSFTPFSLNAQDYRFNPNGGTEALRILSDGKVRVPDNGKFTAGAGDDLQIFHNGTDSKITNTEGNLIIDHSDGIIRLDPKTNENGILIRPEGAVELYYDNSKKLETTATGVTVSGTVSDSKGDLRKIIFKQESSAYTLVAADAGKAIEIAAGGITVPNGVFGGGDAITIINDSGSSQSITMGTGLGYMFNTGTGNSGNLTLAGRGMATIYFVNSTTCYISGGGLS